MKETIGWYWAQVSPNRIQRSEAWRIVGGLSRTQKMPCHSWGLSATHCRRGAKLREIPGTVCSRCYARKGFYPKNHVQRALKRRLDGLKDPRWIAAMAALLKGERYFRWFDAGDLQGLWLLEAIAEVCKLTPECKHWLSTRERRIVQGFLAEDVMPENLNIRLSADYIGVPFAISRITDCTWSIVSRRPSAPSTYDCPATFGTFRGRTCNLAGCRACWEKSVPVVNYKLH